MVFEVGRAYKRRQDIHARHGGQRQGGISTLRDAPYMFTGEEGEHYGYSDRWVDDGVIQYVGEGQLWRSGSRSLHLIVYFLCRLVDLFR